MSVIIWINSNPLENTKTANAVEFLENFEKMFSQYFADNNIYVTFKSPITQNRASSHECFNVKRWLFKRNSIIFFKMFCVYKTKSYTSKYQVPSLCVHTSPYRQIGTKSSSYVLRVNTIINKMTTHALNIYWLYIMKYGFNSNIISNIIKFSYDIIFNIYWYINNFFYHLLISLSVIFDYLYILIHLCTKDLDAT